MNHQKKGPPPRQIIARFGREPKASSLHPCDTLLAAGISIVSTSSPRSLSSARRPPDTALSVSLRVRLAPWKPMRTRDCYAVATRWPTRWPPRPVAQSPTVTHVHARRDAACDAFRATTTAHAVALSRPRAVTHASAHLHRIGARVGHAATSAGGTRRARRARRRVTRVRSTLHPKKEPPPPPYPPPPRPKLLAPPYPPPPPPPPMPRPMLPP